ncbi:MAG: hypothetical protein AMJ60_09640 [Desulfobacterales bacterium SG8_35]|nr:MAG: hypothetical protein AMJ60_09640 [Desulfobacterales bacterium SG8_35]
MYSAAGKKKRAGFRRVSRARIFDGPALKAGLYAVTVMVSVYMFITAAISLLFSYFHEVDFSLVLWALLPGALLGYFLLVMERSFARLKEYMFPGMGRLLTAFLLFFVHTIGYLALSSVIVSYSIGYVMETFWNMPGMAAEYSLFSANFFLVLAILSWLRNVRTLPCRCL